MLHRGGWLNPDSSDWFSEYTQTVAGALGDFVKNYFIPNESKCFIGLSYLNTAHAPGITHTLKDNLQMAHNVLLSHGKAVQALRGSVGVVRVDYAPTCSSYYPVAETPEHIEAARRAMFDVDADSRGMNIAWWF